MCTYSCVVLCCVGLVCCVGVCVYMWLCGVCMYMWCCVVCWWCVGGVLVVCWWCVCVACGGVRGGVVRCVGVLVLCWCGVVCCFFTLNSLHSLSCSLSFFSTNPSAHTSQPLSATTSATSSSAIVGSVNRRQTKYPPKMASEDVWSAWFVVQTMTVDVFDPLTFVLAQ